MSGATPPLGPGRIFVVRIEFAERPGYTAVFATAITESHVDSIMHLARRDGIDRAEAFRRAAMDSVRMGLEARGVPRTKFLRASWRAEESSEEGVHSLARRLLSSDADIERLIASLAVD